MYQYQSADDFINTLKRLFARRGQPDKTVSDDGTNFTAAEKELNRHIDADVKRQPWDWMNLQPCLCASFWGCMGTTQKISQRLVLCIIGSQILTNDIFNNVRCEVEHFMNTRPITTVSSSPDEVEAVISNYFLLGRAHASMPPLQTQQPSILSRQWLFAQQLATHIWKRLMKDFISTLLPRQRWTKKTPHNELKEIVWILQDMMPRRLWPIGRSQETNQPMMTRPAFTPSK